MFKCTLCLKKNDTHVAHDSINAHQPIFVIFSRDVVETRYTLPAYTGHIYGPYLRAHFLRPYILLVYTVVILDTRIYGPYIRAVLTARIYG